MTPALWLKLAAAVLASMTFTFLAAYHLGQFVERARTLKAITDVEARLALRASQRAHDAARRNNAGLRVVKGGEA